MRYIYLPVAVATALLASCVGQKAFTIITTPEGATVSINGKQQDGTTPLTTTIQQDKDLGIVVEKPGYQVESVTINTQTSWWRALLWTENDPNARYIEEDSVTIPLTPLRTNATYTPSILEPFRFPEEEHKPLNNSPIPELRPLPEM